MSSINKAARIAGLLYLGIVVFGIFSELFVRNGLMVPGDPAATVQKIKANEWLFRLGFVSDIICQVCHFFLVLILYRMFRLVNKNEALFMLACVMVSVAITLLNLLHQFAVLLLLDNSVYSDAFSSAQINALVHLFMDMQHYGYRIPGVFFGLWLYPLGQLIYRSGYFPKWVGRLLMIGCFGYLIEFLVTFLLPEYEWISYPGILVATVAELSVCICLLAARIQFQPFRQEIKV